jgi:tetratricopeptide (TPR) repeat protein
MSGTIFINYRREDSISIAGRLQDRLSQTFGRKNIFMDVDHIPAGVDFVAYLNSQVAACKIILVVIGPHWLEAKDENGGRRIDNPDDFVTIEIATALARNIRVIPVLVDGAHMPKAGELPDPLKTLARRQAVEVRQVHFGRDAEALVERVNEALDGELGWQPPWRGKAVAGAAAAVLLVLGSIGFSSIDFSEWAPWAETGQEVKARADAEMKRKADEAEQYRLATLNAERERQAKAEAEAVAKAKRNAEEAEQQRAAAAKAEDERRAKAAAEEAEQQRLASLKAEEDRKRAEADARVRYSTLVFQSNTDINAGNYDRAIATLSEAIRLNPNDALAFSNRGLAYDRKGGYDRAIADFNEAIRLDPKYAIAFRGRGVAYGNKGDYDRAIADFTEAIRLDPKLATAFSNRGLAYERKGSFGRAIADYNEAIRLNPTDATSFCRRGRAKLKINEQGGDADIAKAGQLDAAAFCR